MTMWNGSRKAPKGATRLVIAAGLLAVLAGGVHADVRRETRRTGASVGELAEPVLPEAPVAERSPFDRAPAPRPPFDRAVQNGSCTGGVLTKCYGIVQYCTPVDWNGQACAPSYQCGWCFGWW